MTIPLFDVVEVDIQTNKVVAFMGESKTESNAEAIIKFAVMRRGVETSFYADVPARRYKVGDSYEGRS